MFPTLPAIRTGLCTFAMARTFVQIPAKLSERGRTAKRHFSFVFRHDCAFRLQKKLCPTGCICCLPAYTLPVVPLTVIPLWLLNLQPHPGMAPGLRLSIVGFLFTRRRREKRWFSVRAPSARYEPTPASFPNWEMVRSQESPCRQPGREEKGGLIWIQTASITSVLPARYQ